MDDKLKITGVLSQGYGVIPKLLMRDKEISIEAKGIYAYISSYAGNGSTAFPSISLICSDLGISEKRFYSHKKILEERGYIQVEQERGPNGTFNRNVYTINSVLIPKELPYVVEPSSQNDVSVKKQPYGQKPHTDERHSDKPCADGVGTNNNSLNNNSFNNNNINNNNNNQEKKLDVAQELDVFQIHKFYQENFGTESSFVIQSLDKWAEELSVELVMHALKLTAIAEAMQPYKYANFILRDWANKNYTTIAEVEAAEVKRIRNFKNSYHRGGAQKVEKEPEWLNQEPTTEEELLPEDVQAKFEERLKRFREGGRAVND